MPSKAVIYKCDETVWVKREGVVVKTSASEIKPEVLKIGYTFGDPFKNKLREKKD